MADVFDYLAWRGELTLAQSPFNCVDALILSVLAYMSFGDAAPDGEAVELGTAAQALLARGEGEPGARSGTDRRLLEALAGSARFLRDAAAGLRGVRGPPPRNAVRRVYRPYGRRRGVCCLPGYRQHPGGLERGSQYELCPGGGRGSAAPCNTWNGRLAWRQAAAAGRPLEGRQFGGVCRGFCAPETQARIEAVFNNDGPGFAPEVLEAGGYRNILPRVQTFVPQTSIVGMLMGHGDDYTVVRSDQMGIMQPTPYTWQVLGPDFVRLEQVTAGSRLVDRALKDWLAGLTREEQERFNGRGVRGA